MNTKLVKNNKYINKNIDKYIKKTFFNNNNNIYIQNKFLYDIYYFLINNNCCIFGGFIRDLLNNDNKIPNDIDCIMNESQFDLLIKYLKYNNIFFSFGKYIKEEYIPIIDNNNIIKEFTILKIFQKKIFSTNILEYSISNIIDTIDNADDINSYFNNGKIDNEINNNYTYINIDIFIHKNNISIYDAIDIITNTNIDFYSNSLRLLNNNLSINKNLIDKFIEKNIIEIDYLKISEKEIYFLFLYIIIEQIQNKIAIPINIPDKHRIEKMISKNWKVII
jgi:hypothetical protein